jgi:hypothetical protein
LLTEKKIIYYDKLGEENTLPTFEAAKRRANELGIRDILVASTRGSVGLRAAEFFKGYNLVVVAHSQGFKEAGRNEMPNDVQARSGLRAGRCS